jgi:transposase
MSQPVDREAIRILVADIGYQEAAKRTGIAYATLRQWANRGKWNVTRKHSQAVTTVTKPIGDAHAEALAELEGETRMTLAKFTNNAAAAIHKSVHPAKYTKEAVDLAKVMATVHRQDEGKGQGFSLNVLNLGALQVQIDKQEE